MKYPIGTKCWLVRTAYPEFKGTVLTIISHDDLGMTCVYCGSASHLVETECPAALPYERVAGCCLCCLVPIDNPDAKTEITEHEAIEA